MNAEKNANNEKKPTPQQIIQQITKGDKALNEEMAKVIKQFLTQGNK